MTQPKGAWPAIRAVYEDLRALFADSGLVGDAPLPRVTLGLTATDPEPFHAFVWGTARDFGVAGALTNSVVQVTFHVWVTVVASGSDMETACARANAYQAVALQIPLVDNDLGGTVTEIGVPQVKESDSWADSDGRCHSGYLLDYEASVYVGADPRAARVIDSLEG